MLRAYFDPAGSCWRPCEDTLDSASMPSSLTLPEWGMTRGGELFELPTLALRTGAHGCSSLYASLAQTVNLLPTPLASDSKGAGEHGTGGKDLGTEISLLPTPVGTDAKGARNRTAIRRPDSTGHIGDTLTDAVWKIEGRTQESRGASTPPPSPAGNTPSDDPHHGQLTIEDA